MQHHSSYPVKITSRSAVKKRSRRLSWFVVGTSFGIGCSMLGAPGSPPFWKGALHASAVADATTPEPGINVVALALPTKPVLAPAPVAVAAIAKPAYPITTSVKVEEGDTLSSVLANTGVSPIEAQHVIDSVDAVYSSKKLDVGQNVALVLDQDPKAAGVPIITSLKLPLGSASLLEVTRRTPRADSNFDVKKVVVPVERKLAHAGGRIDNSLYETGIQTGIPLGILSNIISAYSYDVDFQREIQSGDTIDVLYEKLQTKEGANAGHGEVIYAELNLSGRNLKIYRYVDKFGVADYYNEKGESIRKALLKTPINGAKVTSGFGMRNHPILGYSKMHRGVDFAAPTGTPIYAAGDGNICFVGHRGGYGNYLRIHHNNQYDSAYAHISRFAAGVKQGTHVRQGQIVAYVGASGMATGPHLHYEILRNNEQINPNGVKFKTGNVLAGKELTAFRHNIGKIEAQLATTPRKTDVAMATMPLANN